MKITCRKFKYIVATKIRMNPAPGRVSSRPPGTMVCHEWMRPFRKLIHTQISFLNYSSLGGVDPNRSTFVKFLYLSYKVWMLTMMNIFAITILADIYVNWNKLSVTTDDGCIFAGIVVVIFKAIIHQARRKDMIRLLNDILNCADDLCEFSDAEGAKEIISNNYVLNKVIFHGFSGLGFILGIALLFFSPLENGLPIRARYPFNTTIPPWQQIAFGVETCTVLGGLLSIVAMDSLTTLKCSLITTLFNVLNANFENCTSRNENTDKFCEGYERKLNNKFHRRYKTCIQFHQRLVSMTNDYNRIYSSSMFVQMLSSTSMICLTGFQAVVVGGQSSDIFKFGVYLSAAVSQLFYACWIGNELSYASAVVDRSLWLSDWHHENLQSILQTFTLSMTFSRQPLVLKAGVFYVLSLQTFIVIIKRSYSAFTLLNNMDV